MSNLTQKSTSEIQMCFYWRHHPESDRGIKVLQTSALPLGYGAGEWKNEKMLLMKISTSFSFLQTAIMERITGLEPATSTLARSRSTKWAKSAFCGASDRNRTNDTGIFSPLLYQLSYRGTCEKNRTPASDFSITTKWRPEGDSNPWPLAWQASVLTNWTTGP